MPRVSAKAIIIRNGALLAIEKRDDLGPYFILPGGGQEQGESLHDAVKRECLEELNADVYVGELLFARDYIGKNHEFAAFDGDVHCLEVMFRCSVPSDYVAGEGSVPDEGQVGVRWLPLDGVDIQRLYPKLLRPILADSAGDAAPRDPYLGDVN